MNSWMIALRTLPGHGGGRHPAVRVSSMPLASRANICVMAMPPRPPPIFQRKLTAIDGGSGMHNASVDEKVLVAVEQHAGTMRFQAVLVVRTTVKAFNSSIASRRTLPCKVRTVRDGPVRPNCFVSRFDPVGESSRRRGAQSRCCTDGQRLQCGNGKAAFGREQARDPGSP